MRSVDGREDLAAATEALRGQDAAAARDGFTDAANGFGSASRILRFPLLRPARVVPFVGAQFRSARALAEAGELAARAGRTATDAVAVAPVGWAIREGRIDVAAVRAAALAVKEALPDAVRAVRTLERSPQAFLLPPLETARADALDLIRPATRGLRFAATGLDRLPSFLGAGGVKRYVIAFVNPAELRGAGGFFGYFTLLEARDGRFDLLGGGRPIEEFPPLSDAGVDVPGWYADAYDRYGGARSWQNANMTADVPTAAEIVMQAGAPDGGPVDGVVQIDPRGIASLLRIAGSIKVPPATREFTHENVEEVVEHRMYISVPNRRARERFTGALVDAAFNKALGQRIRVSERTLRTLGDTAAGGHIRVWTKDPLDQAALSTLDLTGAVRRAGGASDVLGVFSSNAVGNKLDWFLRRNVSYRARLDPATGSVTGTVRATFSNRVARPERLPPVVVGSRAPGVPSGTNRQIVVLVRPHGDGSLGATVDGRETGLLPEDEGPLSGFHTVVQAPPGGDQTLEARFRTPAGLRGDRDRITYQLHILHQPAASDDTYDVSIYAPRGWRVVGTSTFRGTLTRDLVLDVTLRRGGAAGIVDTLVGRPWRLLTGALGRLF